MSKIAIECCVSAGAIGPTGSLNFAHSVEQTRPFRGCVVRFSRDSQHISIQYVSTPDYQGRMQDQPHSPAASVPHIMRHHELPRSAPSHAQLNFASPKKITRREFVGDSSLVKAAPNRRHAQLALPLPVCFKYSTVFCSVSSHLGFVSMLHTLLKISMYIYFEVHTYFVPTVVVFFYF